MRKVVQISMTVLAISLAASTTVVGISAAWGFARSEDELMRAELTEARARARDFEAQQEREKKAIADRERAANEMTEKRKKEEERLEQIRQDYVNNRKDPRIYEAEQARLEALDDASKRAEDATLEKARLKFIEKRARLREALERDAFIDENKEYDIHNR